MRVGDLVRFNLQGLDMMALGILVGRKGMMWEVLWNSYNLPALEHAAHLELVNENR